MKAMNLHRYILISSNGLNMVSRNGNDIEYVDRGDVSDMSEDSQERIWMVYAIQE